MQWKSLAKYIRECRECGHKAEYKAVETYSTDKWKDTPCKRCRSAALDHGSWRHAEDCTCRYCLED